MKSLHSGSIQRQGLLGHQDHEGPLEDLGSDQLFVVDLTLLEHFLVEVQIENVLSLRGVEAGTRVLLRLTIDADQRRRDVLPHLSVDVDQTAI